jgi:predicted GIY-YIG superfamily endonuclease
MITVYVLRSLSSDIYYTGMTENIENRIREHNGGKSKFTSGHLPWILIYTENHPDWASARIREKYLKSTAGKNWLRNNYFKEE